MTMDGIKCVFFDWGGTLCTVTRQQDTFRECAEAAQRSTRLFNYRFNGDATMQLADRFVSEHHQADHDDGHPEIDLAPIVRQWLDEQAGQSPASNTVDTVCGAFWQAWVGCLDEIPGSRHTLIELQQRGYRLGIVSNCATPKPFCLAELDRLGFRNALSVFTFSSQIGRRKPHGDVYAHAMKQIDGVSPHEILFVGDSPINDVVAPAALGMKTALLPDHAGHWPPHHYDRAHPDLGLNTVADLLDTLH